MCFIRAWIDYIHSNGWTIADVVRDLNKSGKSRINYSYINNMSKGTNKPFVYLWILQQLAEGVGLTFSDFVEVKHPLVTDPEEASQ